MALVKTLAIEVRPEIDYTAALGYARAMRQHYASLIASLDKLAGHECGNDSGQCGDTEGKSMWHVAVYLPDGKEADVLHEIQHDLGAPVYRAWPVGEDHNARMAEMAHALAGDHECPQECCASAIAASAR